MITLQDARRAASRATGPATRAQEIKVEQWVDLVKVASFDPDVKRSPAGAPFGGVRIWIIATLFLLREVELGYLTLDGKCIRLDEAKHQVTLHLTVQKKDPAGRGAWRTLSCSCQRHGSESCPFHLLKELVQLQLVRVGLNNQAETHPGSIPLIGRRDDPFRFRHQSRHA